MKETKRNLTIFGINWKFVIVGVLILIIVFFMINPFKDRFSTQKKGVTCYESFCVKYTIDMFDDCVRLGYESSGFLSGNYYYLCDGVKIVNKCLEYEWVETNQTTIQLGMRCEEDE